MLSNTLMCCMAHPDDAELWAGGTLLLHRQIGVKIILVCFDTGEPERNRESEQAARLLDANLVILPRKDKWWLGSDDDLRRLTVLMNEERPRIVITHASDDTHPEHQLVHRLVVKAGIRHQDDCARHIQIYECAPYLGRTSAGLFCPDLFLDITDLWPRKLAAIRAFTSQNPDTNVAFIDGMSQFFGGLCGVERAEGFRRYPLLGLAASPTNLFPAFAGSIGFDNLTK